MEKIKIGFIGHSVGSEIIIQTMRQLEQQQNADNDAQFEITASFLLFPTIAHIAQTPNGRKLRPIFNPPLLQLLPLICTVIQPLIWTFRLLLSVIPSKFLSLGGIYAPNTTTLDFLSSPATVKNVLHLAKSEMSSIKAPDLGWYRSNKARIWSYWGEPDGWVGKMGEDVKKVLRDTETEGNSTRVQEDREEGTRVVDCVDSVPHAFCLGKFRSGLMLLSWSETHIWHVRGQLTARSLRKRSRDGSPKPFGIAADGFFKIICNAISYRIGLMAHIVHTTRTLSSSSFALCSRRSRSAV